MQLLLKHKPQLLKLLLKTFLSHKKALHHLLLSLLHRLLHAAADLATLIRLLLTQVEASTQVVQVTCNPN